MARLGHLYRKVQESISFGVHVECMLHARCMYVACMFEGTTVTMYAGVAASASACISMGSRWASVFGDF